MIRALLLCLTSLWRDRGGNVLMMTGFALVPMIFATGFGVDYSRAMRVKTILDAAADAAALSAVSNLAMTQTAALGQTVALANFKAQASTLTAVTFNAANDLTITVADTSSTSGTGRQVVVTWRAKSTNIFSTILGSSSLAISGSATASALKPPYVNYYVLLDTSPSMLLPTTSAGLSAVRSATSATSNAPYGCAFACHTKNPHNDSIYIRNTAGQDIWLDSSGNAWPISGVWNGYVYSPNYANGTQPLALQSSGQYADGYWLTRNYSSLYGGSLSILLRIDEERSASQNLITTAQTYATSNQVSYKMQFYGFNWTHSGASSPLTALTSSMTDVKSLSTSSVPDLYAAQDNWYKNNCPYSNFCNSDMGTEFANAMSSLNAVMPAPGDGSSSATPQEVLLIITDGVPDETYNGGRWTRELNPADLAQCSAIKTKGITIGIIYTTYSADSITGDTWSQTVVGPHLSSVASTLQSCASTSSAGAPLFFEVGTDGSITNALAALFAMTLQTARLVK